MTIDGLTFPPFALDGPVDVVDLSLPIHDGAPSYPSDPPCVVTPFLTIPEAVANTRTIAMGSHQGTHLDAPFHFLADGATVDEIPTRADDRTRLPPRPR